MDPKHVGFSFLSLFDKKILFKSHTHYSYYQGVYDNDGTLRCLIAADSQLGNEDKYKLLDLKGHSLLPDNYDVIKVLDDSVLCKDFNGCIAFADYNGNLTITDYYYSESLKEDDLFMVSKSVDGKNKYNYIDSHGNLLFSEFCENLENTVDNVDDYINNHEEGNPRDVSTDEIKKLEAQYDYVRQYGHVRNYNNGYYEDDYNLIDVYLVRENR